MSDKSVEVAVTLRANRDQVAIFGPNPKPGFSVNRQMGNNPTGRRRRCCRDAEPVPSRLPEDRVPEHAEAFSGALNDLTAKHWPQEA